MRFGGEPRAGRKQFPERGDLGFADKPAREDTGISCGGNGEASVAKGQAEVMDRNGDVKQPRRPKLPSCPTTQRGSQARGRKRRGEIVLPVGPPGEFVGSDPAAGQLER